MAPQLKAIDITNWNREKRYSKNYFRIKYVNVRLREMAAYRYAKIVP